MIRDIFEWTLCYIRCDLLGCVLVCWSVGEAWSVAVASSVISRGSLFISAAWVTVASYHRCFVMETIDRIVHGFHVSWEVVRWTFYFSGPERSWKGVKVDSWSHEMRAWCKYDASLYLLVDVLDRLQAQQRWSENGINPLTPTVAIWVEL